LLAGTKVILGNTDIIMIGAIKGEGAAAIFKVAEQASQIALVSVQINTVAIGQHVARMYRQKDIQSLQKVVRNAAWIMLVFCVAVTFLLVLFGEQILVMLFGARFAEAYLAMVILSMGVAVKIFAGPAAVLLNMSGHERDTLRGVLVAALTNVVLNALLIPYFDIVGAALASAIAFGAWSIMLTRLAYQRTGINTTVFPYRQKK
jgi:O-antigen/teichoic acid export membrane protein